MSLNPLLNSLTDSTLIPKVKTIKEEKVGVCFLIYNILGVEGDARVPKWGLGQVTSKSIIHTNLQKPNNKLVNV
jgi:hypothetical protein